MDGQDSQVHEIKIIDDKTHSLYSCRWLTCVYLSSSPSHPPPLEEPDVASAHQRSTRPDAPDAAAPPAQQSTAGVSTGQQGSWVLPSGFQSPHLQGRRSAFEFHLKQLLVLQWKLSTYNKHEIKGKSSGISCSVQKSLDEGLAWVSNIEGTSLGKTQCLRFVMFYCSFVQANSITHPSGLLHRHWSQCNNGQWSNPEEYG